MTLLDYLLVLIILVSLSISFRRGFARELLSLLSWVGAIVIANIFSLELSIWLPEIVAHPGVRIVLSFFLIMVFFVFVFSFISLRLVKIVALTGLNGVDKGLGIFFGLARALVVIVLVILVAGLTPLTEQQYWKASKFLPELQYVANLLQERLPDEISSRLDFGD